jgi:hypothetical protein
MMRSLLAVFALVITFSTGIAADKHISKEGKYAVSFPVKPTDKTTEVEAPPPIGKIILYVSSLDVKKDLAFMVTYNDYPEVVAKLAPQKILIAVRDHSRGTGAVVADGEISDANAPAREYIIEKEGTFYRSRTILSGTRLYQIAVVGKGIELVTSKPADEFIKSFEMIME